MSTNLLGKCTADDAVRRAQDMADAKTGQYCLGTGNWNEWPESPDHELPWTDSIDAQHPGPASDCAGFAITHCWRLKRHHPGFNKGPWATIEDDINNNSALEDGQHHHELFDTLLDTAMPRPGDLLVYPTIYLKGADGVHHTFIGHVSIIEKVPVGFVPGKSHWSALTVIQCHGPNGFKPGVVRTDGSIWDHHDSVWPLPEHKSHVVRPKERQ